MTSPKKLLFFNVVLMAFLMLFSSCSNSKRQVNEDYIKSYILSINKNLEKIDVLLVSEKYIADPDSIAIASYVKQIPDTSLYGMEQKMWLLTGNEIYFSSFLNKGCITGKQIDNIKRVSAQYNELGIQPKSYAIFSIVKYTDLYGQCRTSQLAFLLNDNDSIIKYKTVDLCPEMLNLFSNDDISRITD